MKHDIRPSLIDRLSANQDGYGNDAGYSVHRIRECLLRDLNLLLNTRNRFISPPAEYKEIQGTVLNYGLPDLGGLNLVGDRAKSELAGMIELTLKKFEPRFRSVKLHFLTTDIESGQLRFRIEAMMHADPAPELVVFDTVLDTSEKTVDVRESRV